MSPTMKKVLIGMGVALVLISGLVGLVFTITEAPVKVAKELVEDISQDKIEEGYKLTTKAFQDSEGLKDAPGFVGQHPDFKNISEITFSSRSITNDTSELKGRIKTATTSYDLDVKLIHEDSGWKVYTIDIVPF